MRGARCLVFAIGAAAFRAAHGHAAPAIRRRIAHGSEYRLVRNGVERTGAEFQSGLQGETLGMSEPFGTVLERGAFPVATLTHPKTADKALDGMQVGVPPLARFSPGEADALGEAFFVEFASKGVVAYVRNIGQPLVHAESEQDGSPRHSSDVAWGGAGREGGRHTVVHRLRGEPQGEQNGNCRDG